MQLIALCIWLTSRGPAIFAQKRVGRGGRLFSIYKFRSMAADAENNGAGLTKSGDLRVTAIGKWLRRLKLDELPQFYNVLRGDMSIVGPRPKLPEFADSLNLAWRPGITGAASLAFRREEEILASVPHHQVHDFYQQRIKPLKASIDARYAIGATFSSDLRIIASTVFAALAVVRRTPRDMSAGIRLVPRPEAPLASQPDSLASLSVSEIADEFAGL